MSRIGRKPIDIPKEIKVNVNNKTVGVEGPKGKLSYAIPDGIDVSVKDSKLLVTRSSDLKFIVARHGLVRALIANMVKGVSEGFEKQLEIVGVGYKAQVEGKKIVLALGFTHLINFSIPEGIEIQVPKPTQIVVKGIEKAKVGEVAAELRSFYPPEPYKGKGIRYVGEYVRKKAGKAVA